MSKWSDLSKLRLEMDMLQSKVKNMYKRGCSIEEIAYTLSTPERSIRVIVKWRCEE